MITIIQALQDPQLFAPWFKNPETWRAWTVFLKALFNLPLDPQELELYRKCTGRKSSPVGKSAEAWLIVGRRGGKSFVVALIAVFLACFRDYRAYLQPGERATVMILAADRRQARVIMRYVVGLLHGVAMLERMIEAEAAESIDLTNRTTIEIHTASFRAVRGYTVAAALADEIAFWRSEESANPDVEIINALRPAMATIPGALLIGLSSPYARRGVLYEAHRDHFGRDDHDVLVWQADTPTMNPTVPQKLIDRAYERDTVAAAAEYGARFRSDLEAFVNREALDACVVPGRYELPPVSALPEGQPPVYVAFVDPSGGSQDSMTLAIAHTEGNDLVLDCIREWKPPFSPDAVVQECATTLKSYGLCSVTGDRYGGEWPRERFSVHGVYYELSPKTKSDLYLELLPRLNSGTAELLDHIRLITQLANLERRTARNGKDSIDHPPRGHDDLANAVAGALFCATESASVVGDFIVISELETAHAVYESDAMLSPWLIGGVPPWH